MKAKELYTGIFSRHADAYRRRMDEVTARGEARGRMALIDWVAPKPGERILDLACGPGTLTFLLARAVLPDGEVLGIDLAAGMIDEARRAAPPGLPVSFALMDVENLTLQAGSYDAVTCAHGLHFCPDLRAALRQAYRVLRAGGRFGASVPVGGAGAAQSVLDRVALESLGPPPKADELRTAEIFEDPARFEGAGRSVGFGEVHVLPVEEVITWRDSAHLLGMIESWCTFAGRLDRVDDDRRRRFLRGAEDALERDFGRAPITETRLTHVLCAQK
jgi:SAM-dependent methyltransferase